MANEPDDLEWLETQEFMYGELGKNRQFLEGYYDTGGDYVNDVRHCPYAVGTEEQSNWVKGKAAKEAELDAVSAKTPLW